MLGVTHPLDLLGTRAAGDKTNLLALVKPLAEAGYPLLFTKAGAAVVDPAEDAKAPISDPRTSPQRKADDEAAREAAKADGNPHWANARSKVGRYLATTDIKRLTSYLTRYRKMFGDSETPNLALRLTGKKLIIVDADQAEDVATFQEAYYQATGEHIEPTVLTPGVVTVEGQVKHKGGGHFYFLLPDGYVIPEGITKWAPPGAGWEVMVRDAYVLVPPSVRTEGPYVWQGGVQPAPEGLLGSIEAYAADRARQKAERAARRSEGPCAIDDWAADTDWADVLTDAGFAPAGRHDGCGPECEIWTAPGVHASPKSATAHAPGCSEYSCDFGHGPLHLWTSTLTPELETMVAEHGSTVTKMQVYAAVRHHGDIAAACRELRIGKSASTVDFSDLNEVPSSEPSSEPETGQAAHTPQGSDAATTSEPTETADDAHVLDVLDRLDAAGFWNMTPGLGKVHRAAAVNGVSAWGVLAAVLPRVAANVPPHVRLVKSNGQEGARSAGCSLNFFTILAGPPEAGKTETMACAEELVDLPEHAMEVPEGTGEGAIKSFAEVKKVTDDDGVTSYVQNAITDTVVMVADEISGVLAEMARDNSKFSTTIRSAWVGKRIGTTTGEVARRTNLPPQSYRFTMVMGGQLTALGPVFAEGSKGTPQRILWMPAFVVEPETSGGVTPPLALPAWPCIGEDGAPILDSTASSSSSARPVWIHRPPAAQIAFVANRAERIRTRRSAFSVTAIRERDDEDDVQGHELLHRLKISTLIAAMDGLTQPTDTHWDAAGMVMAAREATVRMCMAAGEAHAERDDEKAGAQRGRQQAAAKAAESSTTELAMVGVGRRVLHLLGTGGVMTRGALSARLSKRQLGYLDAALAGLIKAERIAKDGKGYTIAAYAAESA